MVENYTIGALARAADVPSSTVRYYERVGLLPPEGRSGANYRSYTERSRERLLFIRAAQANGFTLDDIRSLLDFQDGGLAACGEVQTLIEARLRDLEQRMKQLRTVRGVLRTSLDACRRGASSGRCQVIEGLQRGGPGTAASGARGAPGQKRGKLT